MKCRSTILKWVTAWILPAAILIVAILLRLQVAQDPLWIDELHTAWVVSADVKDVWQRALIGNQSPLWFYGVKWVCSLFGVSPGTVRGLSLLAGTASIIVAMVTVWRWTGSRLTANLCGLLFAIHPDFIWVATEARPYACVQLAFLLQLGLAARLIAVSLGWRSARPDSRSTTWLVAALLMASVVICYLHYSAFPAVIAILMAVTIGCWLQVQRRVWMRQLGWMWLGFTLLASPAIVHGWHISSRQFDWAIAVDPPRFWRQTLTSWSLLVLVPMVFDRISSLRRSASAGGPPRLPFPPAVRLLLATCLCSLAAVLIHQVAAAGGLQHFRYILCGTSAAVLLLAIYLSPAGRGRGRGRGWSRAVAASLIGGAACIYLTVQNPLLIDLMAGQPYAQWRNEPWYAAIDAVNDELAKSPAPVFVFPNLVEDNYLAGHPTSAWDRYYLFPVRGIYRVESPADPLYLAGRSLATNRPLRDSDLQAIDDARRAILIYRANYADVEWSLAIIENQLLGNGNGFSSQPQVLSYSDSLHVATIRTGPGTGN